MDRRTALARCLGTVVSAALAPLPSLGMAQPAANGNAAGASGTGGTAGARGERRGALVLGNGDYRFSPLRNPVNDARAVADALRALGFEVEHRENAGRRTMIDTIRSFVLRAKSYDVRLFYYAGHGVQLNGKNYLVPVDADIRSEGDIPATCADVSEMLERLGHIASGMNLVILDACRNNPFADGATVLADGRRLKFRGLTPSGLAAVDAPTGTLVAFSTAPGAVAIDGAGSSHSLYTKHLLANLPVPGVPVEQLFKRVRIAVTQESKRLQVPWESSSLMGDFCFRGSEGSACGSVGGKSLAR
jgi:uncharacterized caspase-like protein